MLHIQMFAYLSPYETTNHKQRRQLTRFYVRIATYASLIAHHAILVSLRMSNQVCKVCDGPRYAIFLDVASSRFCGAF